MAWRIEYTNDPWLKKKRKKILEEAVAEAIDEIKRLLQWKWGGGLMLGETVFLLSPLGCLNLRNTT